MNPFQLDSNISDNPHCTDDIVLFMPDRIIFWAGGFLVFIVTGFLLIGGIISKKLREQPGDLIIGIAFADFLQSIYWIILASLSNRIDNPGFCELMGAFGVFAVINEFLYNISFSLYLMMSLRNALRQTKVPYKAFHFVAVFTSSLGVGFLADRGWLGKSMMGTCGMMAICSSFIYNQTSTLIMAVYALLGLFTYLYVKKNAPKCQRAYARRTALLLYYLKYIIVCIAMSALSFTAILIISAKFSSGFRQKDYAWASSISNFLSVCSPLVLSIVRLNDPNIKPTIKKTLYFWRKEEEKHEETTPLLNETPQEQEDRTLTRLLESSHIHFSLPLHKKIEITLTLLSSIKFNSIWKGLETKASFSEHKPSDRFKHQRIFMIDEQTITSTLPAVKEELEKTKYGIVSGTFKVYAPNIFKDFLEKDQSWLNIIESLDFQKNRDQIRAASKADGGKSGEFFFFSYDKKLILKTIPDTEMEVLVNILEQYEKHFEEYPDTLIAKIYGAFTFEDSDMGFKLNMVLFKNLCGLPSQFVLRTYDIKGSKHDRQVIKQGNPRRLSSLEDHVLKDLDFENYEKMLYIQPELREKFFKQVQADSLFFKNMNIIDYSFVVFIVYKKEAYLYLDMNQETDFTMKSLFSSMENVNQEGFYYNMGIIDYLQPYNFQKKTERFFKRLKNLDPNLDTSSQDPEYYSTRFIQFIQQLVFGEKKDE